MKTLKPKCLEYLFIAVILASMIDCSIIPIGETLRQQINVDQHSKHVWKIHQLRGGSDIGDCLEALMKGNFKYGSLDSVEETPATDPDTQNRYIEKYMNATGLNKAVSR